MEPSRTNEAPAGIPSSIYCPRREELQRECVAALKRIEEITAASIAALQGKDETRLSALDDELEHAVGLKERTFGAFWEHTKDHGC